jgi:hypothetical protein
MKKIKRALSLKGKGADETLSELAEQMSFDVNGKDNGESNCHIIACLQIMYKLTLNRCFEKYIILASSSKYIHFYSLNL